MLTVLSRHSDGNPSGKNEAHTQLIGECSLTVILACMPLWTDSWPEKKEWSWCMHTDLHFKKNILKKGEEARGGGKKRKKEVCLQG